MISSKRAASLGRLTSGALVLLIALAGCATKEKDAELEARLKNARSHFALGVDHLENGRVADGLRELLLAESFDPKNPRIHYGIAQAYMYKDKTDEAEAHLLRALELHPDYHDARLSLSALYLETGRYDEAVVQAQKLADDPTFPAPWRALANLGNAQLQLGDRAAARRDFQLALNYRENFWPALLKLGILETMEGKPLQAITLFERALEQNPGPNVQAEVNYHLAEIYVGLGKRERAVGCLMAAVAQTPGGEWGKKSEEYLKLLR